MHVQTLKVVIFGCESVGKSSFVNMNVGGNYVSSAYDYVDNSGTIKTMEVNGVKFQFQILMIHDPYIINEFDLYDAAAVFFMYDSTDRATFKAIENTYLPKLQRCCPNALISILIASKVDKWPAPEVTSDEGHLTALMNNLHFCEVSSKDNINIQKPFVIVGDVVSKLIRSRA
eukprot:TRINITY_DN8435_c0_g1_i3.p1 TRINITY_DN8435_c0_g1~~TRINITY_DN8435_c0_g1_i3.p1  ORF type:complete len:173 (+),score=31.43 TRINITY_DN8435_c0_g1_i3:41-559(+)